MARKLNTLFAAAAVLGGLLASTTVFAERDSSPLPPAPPSAGLEGMMSDHGMMRKMGQMSPDQMKQMMGMMENCSKMMEGMNNTPMAPHPQG